MDLGDLNIVHGEEQGCNSADRHVLLIWARAVEYDDYLISSFSDKNVVT